MDFDVSAITQIIANLGFPIAACIYFAIVTQKQNARHSEEVGELRKVVEQNTLTVQRLVDKLDNLKGVE